MAPVAALDHRKLYRLPWSSTDNIIAWLEPTKQCNITCEGCYSTNAPRSHKSLEKIREDLDVFERYRQTDAVSIAGGEPLTHPQIAEVVRMVAERGLKPIVNTNGVALTPELLLQLKAAGLRGFTFHIDSLQKRPGWTGKSELELCELRMHFARMAASVGGISCAFNATVYEKTLPCVPDLVDWARRHAELVHVMVFIAFRGAIEDRFDYYVGRRRLDPTDLGYARTQQARTDITSNEIVGEIRKRFPEFEPCAYLNGTEKPDSLKWLLTLPIVSASEGHVGYAGPKFAELSQVMNHLRRGRYLGYIPPQVHRRAKAMLALSGLDHGLGRALRRYLGMVARRPMRLFEPLHLQSVMIIQPIDVLDNGAQSMCDACPDMTVHEGRLVWSCRLEERLRHGDLMRLVPGERGEPVAAAGGGATQEGRAG